MERHSEKLDDDGLPFLGSYLRYGDPLYCKVNSQGKAEVHKYKEDEPCYVEQVCRLDGHDVASSEPVHRVQLKLRYTRNPVVGDKFSSSRSALNALETVLKQL